MNAEEKKPTNGEASRRRQNVDGVIVYNDDTTPQEQCQAPLYKVGDIVIGMSAGIKQTLPLPVVEVAGEPGEYHYKLDDPTTQTYYPEEDLQYVPPIPELFGRVLDAVVQDDDEPAQLWAEAVKSALELLDESDRLEAVTVMRGRAATHVGGATACLLCGIPIPEAREPLDAVTAGVAAELMSQLDTVTGPERDELILTLLGQMALMSPVTVERYRSALINHGVRAPFIDAELKARRADNERETLAAVATKPRAAGGKRSEVYRSTDLGNAYRLVDDHGENIRYCKPQKEWLVWDGKRWATDETDDMQRRARWTVRGMYAQAGDIDDLDERKKFVKWVLQSESLYRLRALVGAAEAEVPVTPNKLDVDPWLLNCDNGTLDLRTGELREHRREDLLTKIIPVAYDPDAACPKWVRFLKDVIPDRELRLFLQRAVGYSLAGVTSEHCLFFAHGIGRNGKSTFFELLMLLLADYAHKLPTETLMLGRRSPGAASPDIARLAGARFVVAAEVEQERSLAESLVKDLCGGDTLTARQLYQKYIDFRPSHTLWMYGNHKPVIKGTDEGIWRRVHLVPFSVVLPLDQVDKELPAKLATELPGILSWAVRGCLEWQADGLKVPAAVDRATSQYRADQDEIGRFIAECCLEEATAYATKTLLFKEYQAWGGELTKWSFGKRLKERGIADEKMTGGIRAWRGIGLVT